MKNFKALLLILFCFACQSSVYSQFKKNSIIVGGAGSFEVNDYKSTDIDINTMFGYYVFNNLAVGCNLHWVLDGQTFYTMSSTMVNLFGRYHLPFYHKFYVQAEGGFLVRNKVDNKIQKGRLGLAAGFNFPISDLCILDISVHQQFIDDGYDIVKLFKSQIGLILFINNKITKNEEP